MNEGDLTRLREALDIITLGLHFHPAYKRNSVSGNLYKKLRAYSYLTTFSDKAQTLRVRLLLAFGIEVLATAMQLVKLLLTNNKEIAAKFMRILNTREQLFCFIASNFMMPNIESLT